MKFYANDLEDKYIYEHCNLPKKGVFVDIGAGDGITGNNTLFLEELGWKGICIDADPRNVEKLQNKRKVGIGSLVSSKDHLTPFYMANDTPDLSGIIKTEANGGKYVEIVPDKLEKILSDHKIKEIDVLSIDTEGSEIDAWESMDWKKHLPKVLIIELVTQGKVNMGLETYFRDLGYKVKGIVGANMIFEWPVEPKRDSKLMVYGSSYDRGLEHLLKMWPDIKKEVPDAKLHIFYGWNLFDKGYADNPERMAWKEKINKLMEQDGIVHLGRISHEAVKEEMQKAGIWAYPTHFGEISCCSGDTPILMPRDHKKYPYGIPIRELEGKSGFYVYSYDHKTDKIKLGRVKWVKITRKNAKLLRITLDDGTILRFTPDHKFLLRNGEYKEAKDLTVGESLMPCYEKPTFAIKQTDGSWPEEHRMMAETLWGDNIKGKVVDHKNGNRYDNTPDNLQLLTPSEHTQKMATKERVQTTVSKKRMSESQKRLAKTPERIAWNSINGTNRANKFWKIFRSWPTEKQKEWTKNRAEKRNHSVIDICEDSIKEDVYDMEVDKYHTFAAGGVFVHNCITAMKAQCYGAIPVVIDYAALKETVQYGIKIDGDIYEKEIKDKYLNELVSLLKNPSRQEDILKQMMPWARETFVWSRVAEQWDKEFKTFSCPIIPLEKQVEDLMEDNQALKAWDLVKDTESPLKERVWLRVKHAFEPEAYEKYYKEEMKEVPLPEDLALDCTKYAPRFKWLIEKIEQQKPEKIIDLGCADGYTGLTLAKRGFKNYLGVNLNTASIEIAKSRAKNYNLDCTFTNKDMFEIEGKYDAVIMFEILEHLPDMKKAVEKAVSLLSDNGRLYISTPRVDHLGVELHKKEKHGTWDDGKPSGHLRLLTDHELKALLSPYKIYDFALDEERSMLTEVGKR